MFKSILFLNGTIPPATALPPLDHMVCVVADGALSKVLAQGYVPHVVVGDGDTLADQDRMGNYQVIVESDQETTDFEKCLSYLSKHHLFPALISGIGGGEIDHQHNNLHCFVKYAKDHPMVFMDWQAGYESKIGIAVSSRLHLHMRRQSIVSLLPFPKARLRTEGLAWPLHDEVLSLLERSGARNVSSAPEVLIELSAEGPLLVVLDAHAFTKATIDGWNIRGFFVV